MEQTDATKVKELESQIEALESTISFLENMSNINRHTMDKIKERMDRESQRVNIGTRDYNPYSHGFAEGIEYVLANVEDSKGEMLIEGFTTKER